MVECFVFRTKTERAALDIRETDERPHLGEIVGFLAGDIEGAVEDGLLKVQRSALGAADEPRFAKVVLRHAPLAAVRRRGFLQRIAARAVPAEAVGVVAGVNPIIQTPDQAARLMLQIPAARSAGEPQFLLVCHAVAVGVAVKIEIVRVRLTHEHPAIQWQDHARQHQPVDEDAMPVENAIAFARPVERDAARPGALVRAIEVPHEGTHLGDEHAPVAIERHGDRFLDVGIAHHQFHAITGRQTKGGEFLLNAQVGGGLGERGLREAEHGERGEQCFHSQPK